MMSNDDAKENLYQRDLNWIPLSNHEELAMKGADYQEPGRIQELFLDYMLSRTGASSHLLGDAFTPILGEKEIRLREALQPLIEFARSDTLSSPALDKVRAFLSEFGWNS